MTNHTPTLEQLRAETIAAAQRLFDGDELAAEHWLNQPLRAIGDKIPLDFMDSAENTGIVRDIIGRLEHGVWT
jgi:putative toxin-antitoxin system antitoxin component (TIGR02293 family)